MVLTYRNGQSAGTFAGNGSVTKPTGTTEGDLVLVALSLQSSTSTITTPPAGFSLIYSNVIGSLSVWLWGKIAGSSEPATYAVDWSGSTFFVLTAETWSVDGSSTPITEAESSTATATDTISTVSVSTNGAGGAFHILEFVRNGTGPIAPATPAGYTARVGSATSSLRISTYSKSQASAGASGAITFVHTVSHDQLITVALALDAPIPAPEISSIDPESGPTDGGTDVTISGTGFIDGATVSFGGEAATAVAYTDSTELVATTPAEAEGAVDVIVTNPDAQFDTLVDGFTYEAPASDDSRKLRNRRLIWFYNRMRSRRRARRG